MTRNRAVSQAKAAPPVFLNFDLGIQAARGLNATDERSNAEKRPASIR
jgi:hypothetical protein